MKTRSFILAIAVAALTGLYMLIPACGNNNSQTPQAVLPYGGYGGYGYNGYGYPGTGGVICQPGQVCPTGLPGVAGVPLVPAPVIANIDSAGSTATMTFGGTSVVAGQLYNGPVTITGVLNILPGGLCPPGAYQISGQGQWAGNYGSTLGKVVANLQLVGPYPGMAAQISGLIYAGQDPNSRVPTQYYLTGIFATSCDPGGTAL